jgi:glycogen(starch) synthase
MRILHMTTEFPPVVFGGLGTAVGGLVHALARAGDALAVLLVGGGPAAAAYGRPAEGAADRPVGVDPDIVFFQVPWTGAVAEAARIAREWRADLVHLHTAWIWPFAETVLEAGFPVVYTAHSVDRAEYEFGQEPGHILDHADDQGRAVAGADRLIALTGDEADLLVHYYPETRERIRIVGNGIDDSEEARRAAQRSRGDGPLLVLYSGRLVERKGIQDLLAAIPAVLEQAPDTRFVLAGGPPGYGGEELARQWLPPECLPYADRIHFTGWLTMQEIEEWYRRADIQVIPSRYEPFGMVVLEGMLHGLPIIATRVGGPTAILEDGRTGLLVPPFHPEALAGALRRLVEDRELRLRLGAAAAAAVREMWLWPRIAERMRAVYAETVVAFDLAARLGHNARRACPEEAHCRPAAPRHRDGAGARLGGNTLA